LLVPYTYESRAEPVTEASAERWISRFIPVLWASKSA
jgi:hypothetical protein